MRDALSLLDQAIAYGGESVNALDIHHMLGSVEQSAILHVLNALAQKKGPDLLSAIRELDAYAPDYAQVLEHVTRILHQIAIQQTIVEARGDNAEINALSDQLSLEEVQLYYQIALLGKRDLPLTTNPIQGFEMTLLRMLAFTLGDTEIAGQVAKVTASGSKAPGAAAPTASLPLAQRSGAPSPTEGDGSTSGLIRETSPPRQPEDAWGKILGHLNLSGMALTIAANCALINIKDNNLELALSTQHETMLSKKITERIEESLTKYYDRAIKLTIKITAENLDTCAKQLAQQKIERLASAVDAIQQDTTVQKIKDVFGATLLEDSIKATELK
jgi:DNA polymerase-3 subunit gamma/tau